MFHALHQPGNRPKGKVNMHCSRHTLIGLFGHCPEAKTHFTVSNPKHGFNMRKDIFYNEKVLALQQFLNSIVYLGWENIAIDFSGWHVLWFSFPSSIEISNVLEILSHIFPFAAVVIFENMSSHQSTHSKQDLWWLSHNNNCRCIFHTPLKLIFHEGR